MAKLTQTELEAVLFREWPRIQATRAFGWRLPAADTHQWMREGHAVGYATLDYKLERNVAIPNAWGDQQPGVVPLLEHYWAVRTKDGRQDPGWLPSLNIHVVHPYVEPPTIKQCEAALRNALVLRRAAHAASDRCFGNDAKANCYARAYVIGPEIRPDVAALAAMEEFEGIQLHVGRYRYTALNGFEFEEPDDLEGMRNVALLNDADNRKLGEMFFADAILPEQRFAWQGTNNGPLFDRELGMKTQDGRVL